MTSIDRAINIADLRRLAKRRLPRILFDYIEGGVEDEIGLRTNRAAFEKRRLVPRYLVDTSGRSQKTTLFGQEFASPFGFSPTGLAGLFRPQAEEDLARLAVEANLPYVMACTATAAIEECAPLGGRNLWFQLYNTRDREVGMNLVKRAEAAGVRVLAVTCDTPGGANRERNKRNGFALPLRMSLSTILESALHPAWVWEFVARGGLPAYGNWNPPGVPRASMQQGIQFFSAQVPDPSLTWRDVERIRAVWPGKLVIKGVLHPEDAKTALACGADGILVSNHGGRQLDLAPSPLDVLPAIRAAVGPDATLLMESGVMRGSDIVTALCLGANFVLAGRAILYGIVAGGAAGGRKAVSILQREVDGIMSALGVRSPALLNGSYLLENMVP